MGGLWLYHSVNVLNDPEHVKMVDIVNLMSCLSYHNSNKEQPCDLFDAEPVQDCEPICVGSNSGSGGRWPLTPL